MDRTILPRQRGILIHTHITQPLRPVSLHHQVGDCSSSYPGVCIASPPPDLDCIDVFPSRDFRVLPSDPHDFDSDSDGIGCEIGENA
jgi:hypothetical protein